MKNPDDRCEYRLANIIAAASITAIGAGMTPLLAPAIYSPIPISFVTESGFSNATLKHGRSGALGADLHLPCRHVDGEQDEHPDEEESSELHFRLISLNKARMLTVPYFPLSYL